MISAISRTPPAYGLGSAVKVRSKPAFSLADVQAESAKANKAKADMEAQHADAIKRFAGKGINMTLRTRTDDYKDGAMRTVDSDRNNIISTSELSKHASGIGPAQAAALYAAMDMDKDGSVSGQEFKDSIPDPFNTSSFKKKLSDLSHSANPLQIGDLFRSHAHEEAPIGAILGDLGRRLSP